MTLAAGTRLGPYEILSPLGAGGMGEVYRAKDTRLGREVAIKVLPEHLSMDAKVRARFEREAKAISSLNHPHICSLFDVGRENGVEYLVMELVEGQTLAARLAKGPLPLPALLRAGIEIAGALDRAHRQGIVHRDLKPANIMMTKSGVKLLDFGLARYREPVEEEIPGRPSMPTRSAPPGPLTQQGAVLGTFQYMAPEQLEGGEADARSDVFSFGCVLYEMATGRRAFSGKSRASLAGAILRDVPAPISSADATVPPTLDHLVQACLAKDPNDRVQTAHDVGLQLQWIAGALSQQAAPAAGVRVKRFREGIAWSVAVLSILAGAAAAFLARGPGAPHERLRFAVMPPPGQGIMGSVQLSPDGRRLLLLLVDESGKISAAVRPLDGLEVKRVRGAENVLGAFWSPDGQEIAFFSDGKLRRIGVDGGAVQTICESKGAFTGAWSSRGTILFGEQMGCPLLAVSATGGTPRPVTTLDAAWGDTMHTHPAFLPDGTHFLFMAPNIDPAKSSVMLASLESKEVRRLFHADASAVYSAEGYLLFGRDDAVLAWRFDPSRLKLVGDPIPAFQGVHWLSADNYLGLSADGDRIAYQSWSLSRRLVWVDRAGKELGTLGETGGYTDVRISPDGRKVAVSARDLSRGRNLDIWVLDASRGTGTRITADRNDEFNPAWFPGGDRLIYVSDRNYAYDLFERPASGGPERLLVRTDRDKLLPSVLQDGQHVLADSPYYPGQHTLVLFDLEAGEAPRPLSGDSHFSEQHPALSSDGRWAAFDSDEPGQREVFIQPFPQGPRRQVSVGGGQMPVWSRSGSELFYMAPDGMLKSVALRFAGGGLDLSEPHALFLLMLGVSGELPWEIHPYDVSPDGQRFLVIRGSSGAEPDGALVVTDWTSVLKGTP
jgi:eukaryotic-like serine/threonine-protein kinase